MGTMVLLMEKQEADLMGIKEDRNPALLSKSEHKPRRPRRCRRKGLRRSSSVTFTPRNKVYPIRPQTEDVDPDELWYSDDEFSGFRADHMKDAKKLAQKNQIYQQSNDES